MCKFEVDICIGYILNKKKSKYLFPITVLFEIILGNFNIVIYLSSVGCLFAHVILYSSCYSFRKSERAFSLITSLRASVC